MEKEERVKLYRELVEQNGKEHQMIVTIEEMSELIKELTKLLRSDSYSSRKNICDEIADARICLEQIEEFFDPEHKAVESIIDYKLNRLKMFYLNKTSEQVSHFDTTSYFDKHQ